MAESGRQQGVRYWLLKHGGVSVTAGILLFFLLAFGLVKVTGFRQHQGSAGDGAGVAVSSQPAASPVEVSSRAAAPSSQAASAVVSDNPAFDLTGSGDVCRMHYFQDEQGRTVTLFTLTQDGELITHVSGPPGIGRHDQRETRGPVRIVYDFPLSQAADMGAVLYLPDGSSQSCTISAGSDAP